MVFQVWEAHCQGIDLLQMFVKRLDDHALGLLDSDIHVQMVAFSCILLANRDEVMLEILVTIDGIYLVVRCVV